MLLREDKITTFKELYWKIKTQGYREMMSMQGKIPRVKKAGHLIPVLLLIPAKSSSFEEEKGRYIAFELKTRVGQPADSTKYKKYVRKFEEGTPQEWIDMLRDLEEIWTQNSMTGGTDRASTVRALVRGESAVAFETSLQDSRTTEGGETVPISPNHVQQALKAVTETVFPHRALETQKLWMNRKMFKPVELTTRQMAASINRLNNSLPFFPNATEASKFSEGELIGLLEWSLPATWRAKFDLDGYIPTLHSRARLIEACEAIERSKTSMEKPQKEEGTSIQKKAKRAASKISAPPAKKQNSGSMYHCTEHGHNSTHSTADCWTLKNRAKSANQVQMDKKTDKKSFSNRNLRNEINLLAKNSSKKKILEMYASVIQREQAKLKDQPEKRKKTAPPASESEDEMSVQVISAPKKKVAKKVIRKDKTSDVIEEEKDYQRKLQWLKDHGELTGEEGKNPGEESSEDETASL